MVIGLPIGLRGKGSHKLCYMKRMCLVSASVFNLRQLSWEVAGNPIPVPDPHIL